MVSGVANKGGIVIPSGALDIATHGDVTYTFAPDNGYEIQEVSVDGKKIGAVKKYTFKDITKNHTISVAFAPKKGNLKNVKKGRIISTEEAKKYAVTELYPAAEGEDGRSSDIITPDMYEKMKEEGTLEEALKIPEQNVVGMDDTEGLANEVDGYNYDSASGLYQALDLTPEEVKEKIESGDDEEILRTAYEEGYLDILVNNHYLVPGKEDAMGDLFEGEGSVSNMMEFISGVLTEEEKLGMFEGKTMAVNVAIISGEDLSDEEKEELQQAGAEIDEYFYMTVMKQQAGGEPVLVTELEHPIEVVLEKPEGSEDNCIVRLHNGKAEILEDMDQDNETITIRTDKFSPYAFAKESGKSFPVAPVAGVLVGLGLVAALVGMFMKRKNA